MSEKQAGYKYLKSYQLATVIYDLTSRFCAKFLPGDEWMRQRVQMMQAARSGRQNIVEGYLEQSLKLYIKLVGVARASQGELLEDFEDFLRQRNMEIWNKDDPRVKQIRQIKVSGLSGLSGNIPDLPNNPEEAANLMITLINQEMFLLKRQMDALEQKFIREGGYSENLFKKRLEERNKK